MTIRLVRAHFEPSRYQEIDQLMKKAAVTLVPAMQAQPGLIDYYVAINAKEGKMVHVSIWETEREAEAVALFLPLQQTKENFEAHGLILDEITNLDVAWSV
jgi:quinol monooxygenase YgiN